MRLAATDRFGPDASELTLNVEATGHDRPPALGVLVCAIGQGGWKYIGPVVEINVEAKTYTILPVATNPTANKIKAMGLA